MGSAIRYSPLRSIPNLQQLLWLIGDPHSIFPPLILFGRPERRGGYWVSPTIHCCLALLLGLLPGIDVHVGEVVQISEVRTDIFGPVLAQKAILPISKGKLEEECILRFDSIRFDSILIPIEAKSSHGSIQKTSVSSVPQFVSELFVMAQFVDI